MGIMEITKFRDQLNKYCGLDCGSSLICHIFPAVSSAPTDPFLQLQLTQERASLGLARRVAAPFGPGQVEHQPHVFVEDTGPRSWLLLELLGFRLGGPKPRSGNKLCCHGYKHMWFQYGVYMCLLNHQILF